MTLVGEGQHKLNEQPANIVDKFQSVLGEAFHLMDRPKVPVKHTYKRVNRYGLPVYWCLRGTGLTESSHKQMLMTRGQWCAGIEMSDALRSEYRQRYNQRMSERRRIGFPQIGHYDTWLVDAVQILVDYNHNVHIYSSLLNSTDNLDADETFGTVPLQSNELTIAVNQLSISQS